MSPEQEKIVQEKVLKGVCYRAELFSYLFSIVTILYGFTSLEFIKHFDVNVSPWGNLWPRILLNGLPFFLLGLSLRSRRIALKKRVVMAAIFIPAICMMGCLIHVWPLLWSGKTDIYLFVHAANMFLLTASMLMLSAPLPIAIVLYASFVTLMFMPIGFVLHRDSPIIFNTFMNDLALVSVISFMINHWSQKLRRELAEFDVSVQRQLKPFLGENAVDTLYSGRSLDTMPAENYPTVLMSVDVRGFTVLSQTIDKAAFENFIREYHQCMSETVGIHGGKLHKSAGDAHISSFGKMNLKNLPNLPEIAAEKNTFLENQQRVHTEIALRTFEDLTRRFELLKMKFGISAELNLGASLCFGELTEVIRGDGRFKSEMDIAGEVIIRGNRLEAYTKLLNKITGSRGSCLVISPELIRFAGIGFQKWHIDSNERRVRDYPSIQVVAFKYYEALAKSAPQAA